MQDKENFTYAVGHTRPLTPPGWSEWSEGVFRFSRSFRFLLLSNETTIKPKDHYVSNGKVISFASTPVDQLKSLASYFCNTVEVFLGHFDTRAFVAWREVCRFRVTRSSSLRATARKKRGTQTQSTGQGATSGPFTSRPVKKAFS
jgi:hypothetical protein